MRSVLVLLLAFAGYTSLAAHHPPCASRPVRPRIDLIGPMGNHAPMEYRRRFNRPPYALGKAAYYFAPTSQEAIRWHQAVHRGYYDPEAPRMVGHYFYPKPWEAIPMGARPIREGQPEREEIESLSDLPDPTSREGALDQADDRDTLLPPVE